jgi:hypothetical protein
MGTRPTVARRRARSLVPAATVNFTSGRAFGLVACLALLSGGACSSIVPTPGPSAVASAVDSPSSTPASARPTRIEHVGYAPIETGDPIDVAALSGRIVFDDFENVYAMDVDGSSLVTVAGAQGPEFDGSWSPDGRSIVYRDSTRGVNNDDEIDIAAADGSIKVIGLATGGITQLTHGPGEDGWPAWSPDGSTIAFSSQRDDCGFAARDQECWRTGDIGPHHDIWLVNADGSNLRRVTPEFGQFVTWSPDGQYLLISGAGLYVVRPDGTGRLELHAGGSSGAGIPDWR